MERVRLCSRPACGSPATATLTYQYASRSVWLDDLAGRDEPSGYDLCAQHADSLTVPVGWARDDRRSLARLPFPRSHSVAV